MTFREICRVTLVVLLLHSLFSCKEKAPQPITLTWRSPTSPSAIVKTAPDTMLLPSFSPMPVAPDTNVRATYLPIRDGDNNTATVVVRIVGTPIGQVPIDLRNLLTQGNTPLSEIEAGDTLKGWKIQEITFLRRDGNTEVVSELLPDSVAEALSVTLTFFPDGLYTIHNHINQVKHNQCGWYQVALSNGFPIGILYRSLKSGKRFENGPLNEGPTQGMGIWGITKERFFPLVPLNKFSDARDVILVMQSYTYIARR